MRIHSGSKLVIGALGALVFAVGPARADTISVSGSGDYSVLGGGVDERLVGLIGLNADPLGTFDFAFSYDTCKEKSTGSFKMRTYAGGGALMDGIDLTPTDVTAYVLDNYAVDSSVVDMFMASATSSANGHPFSISVALSDDDHSLIPGNPATYLASLGGWERTFFNVWVDDPDDGIDAQTDALQGRITSLSESVVPAACPVADGDGDGVPDSDDACQGTASTGPVDANGCSIDQLVPCAGPSGGGTWRNHGQYVGQLARIAQAFVDAGLITEAQKDAILSAGAGAHCP